MLWYDESDETREAAAALDEIIVFMPASTISCGASVGITQMPGGVVEFEELAFTLTDGCNIHSNARLYFRGCSIDRDDVNASGDNDQQGPIAAISTLDGCVSSNAANDSGLFSDSVGNVQEPFMLLKSYLAGGGLSGLANSTAVRQIVMIGCATDDQFFIAADYLAPDLLVIDRTDFQVTLGLTNVGNVYMWVSSTGLVTQDTIQIDGCRSFRSFATLYECAVHIFSCPDVYFYDCVIHGERTDEFGQLALFKCVASIVNTNTTISTPGGAQPYGLVISQSTVTGLPAVTGTSTVAVDIRDGSRVTADTSSSSGTNTGAGIVLGYGCSLAVRNGAPYAAGWTSVGTNNIKVGANAAVAFSTIATGLAADVNDYGTANPQMASAVFSP